MLFLVILILFPNLGTAQYSCSSCVSGGYFAFCPPTQNCNFPTTPGLCTVGTLITTASECNTLAAKGTCLECTSSGGTWCPSTFSCASAGVACSQARVSASSMCPAPYSCSANFYNYNGGATSASCIACEANKAAPAGSTVASACVAPMTCGACTALSGGYWCAEGCIVATGFCSNGERGVRQMDCPADMWVDSRPPGVSPPFGAVFLPNAYNLQYSHSLSSGGKVDKFISQTAATYEPNKIYTMLISPPQGLCVVLRFTRFETEANYDVATVYADSTMTRKLMEGTSGQLSNIPQLIGDINTAIVVQLTTDSNGERAGLSFSAFACVIVQKVRGCALVMTANFTELRAEKLPPVYQLAAGGEIVDFVSQAAEFYEAWMFYTQVIAPPAGSCVVLNFSKFETELNYGYLHIWADSSKTRLLLPSSTGTKTIPEVKGELNTAIVIELATGNYIYPRKSGLVFSAFASNRNCAPSSTMTPTPSSPSIPVISSQSSATPSRQSEVRPFSSNTGAALVSTSYVDPFSTTATPSPSAVRPVNFASPGVTKVCASYDALAKFSVPFPAPAATPITCSEVSFSSAGTYIESISSSNGVCVILAAACSTKWGSIPAGGWSPSSCAGLSCYQNPPNGQASAVYFTGCGPNMPLGTVVYLAMGFPASTYYALAANPPTSVPVDYTFWPGVVASVCSTSNCNVFTASAVDASASLSCPAGSALFGAAGTSTPTSTPMSRNAAGSAASTTTIAAIGGGVGVLFFIFGIVCGVLASRRSAAESSRKNMLESSQTAPVIVLNSTAERHFENAAFGHSGSPSHSGPPSARPKRSGGADLPPGWRKHGPDENGDVCE
jgi:hypothetical protein